MKGSTSKALKNDIIHRARIAKGKLSKGLSICPRCGESSLLTREIPRNVKKRTCTYNFRCMRCSFRKSVGGVHGSGVIDAYNLLCDNYRISIGVKPRECIDDYKVMRLAYCEVK